MICSVYATPSCNWNAPNTARRKPSIESTTSTEKTKRLKNYVDVFLAEVGRVKLKDCQGHVWENSRTKNRKEGVRRPVKSDVKLFKWQMSEAWRTQGLSTYQPSHSVPTWFVYIDREKSERGV
jgi:hypothetical protein